MKTLDVSKMVKWYLSTLKLFWKVLKWDMYSHQCLARKKLFPEITIEKNKGPTKTCAEIYSWVIGQVTPRVPPRKVWLKVPAVEGMEERASLE